MSGEYGKPISATFEPGSEAGAQAFIKEALKRTIDGLILSKVETVRHSFEYFGDGYPERVPTKNITITIEGREK